MHKTWSQENEIGFVLVKINTPVFLCACEVSTSNNSEGILDSFQSGLE